MQLPQGAASGELGWVNVFVPLEIVTGRQLQYLLPTAVGKTVKISEKIGQECYIFYHMGKFQIFV